MVTKQCKITWNQKIDQDLQKLPRKVREKFEVWTVLVRKDGLEEVRKRPGFHDEPLKGTRSGQRSIRLSRGYRVIYVLFETLEVNIISIQEVTKHGY